MIELGGSFAWCSAERSYHKKPYKPDWGLVKQAPYSNTLHSAHWYQATNWLEKPLDERVKILTDARKGQSMLGKYQNPPFAPYPTKYNYADRVFKRVMDEIYGAGQVIGIPWTDYLGVTYTITKLKEKN